MLYMLYIYIQEKNAEMLRLGLRWNCEHCPGSLVYVAGKQYRTRDGQLRYGGSAVL